MWPARASAYGCQTVSGCQASSEVGGRVRQSVLTFARFRCAPTPQGAFEVQP
jgi:hypothetical protein